MAQSSGLKEVKKHVPSQFTIEFSEFYREIISKLYDVKSRKFLIEVKKALKSIRQLNHDIGNWDGKQFFEHFSYKEPATRCAYMYAYSILNTSVVYCEFLRHLKENKDELFGKFSGKTFRLCCLGGGPGMEAIGICKAIHDIVWESSEDDGHSLSYVYLTIVDVCPTWKSEANLIFNRQKRGTKLFPYRDICFQTEYLEGDLLKPLDGSLQKAIKDSDIVTIIKFASDLQKSSDVDYTPKLKSMVKSVSDCIAEGSCLFMLDTAGGHTFNAITQTLPESKNYFLKKTNLHKAYRLHPTVLQKLENIIDFSQLANTSALLPTPLTRISSCIWIKLHAPDLRKRKKKENEEKEKEKEEKKEKKEKERKEKEKGKEEKKEKKEKERKVKEKGKEEKKETEEEMEKKEEEERRKKEKGKKKNKLQSERSKVEKETLKCIGIITTGVTL